jgi:RNA polymerase sigma-70 factor (ECF subfamily)
VSSGGTETGRDRPGAAEEREIIRAAQAGDGQAFEQLVLRHRNRVFWLAHQVVGNAEDAKDVTQNVLVRLWRVLPKYDERYAFSTWLYRMTVNLAIDSLRQTSRHARDTPLDDSLVAAEPGPTRRPGGAPHSAAIAREVQGIFDELRRLLPPQQRAVFALREIDGLTSEEVAEVLGLSSSTVRNHLLQARRTLQAEMKRRYPEYLPGGARSRGAKGDRS